jgi:hypothetical protein
MHNCKKVREILIDSMYGESDVKDVKKYIEECPECRKFTEDLGVISEKMDILDADPPVNISDIVNTLDMAEKIEAGKKLKFEAVCFAVCALLITAAYAVLSIGFGTSFVIITQGIMFLCLPAVLIPVIIKRGAEEGAR